MSRDLTREPILIDTSDRPGNCSDVGVRNRRAAPSCFAVAEPKVKRAHTPGSRRHCTNLGRDKRKRHPGCTPARSAGPLRCSHRRDAAELGPLRGPQTGCRMKRPFDAALLAAPHGTRIQTTRQQPDRTFLCRTCVQSLGRSAEQRRPQADQDSRMFERSEFPAVPLAAAAAQGTDAQHRRKTGCLLNNKARMWASKYKSAKPRLAWRNQLAIALASATRTNATSARATPRRHPGPAARGAAHRARPDPHRRPAASPLPA